MTLADLIIYESEKKILQEIERYDVNELDRFGFRPLIQAVICNKQRVLQYLLQNGADIEQQDLLGRTPLQWACDRDNFAMSKILLESGADPNHHSADGQPILVNPILRENLELVNLLKQHQADHIFAQDFISAKLLGHRFELSGETDIFSPDKKFIPLSYEGFYLEFSVGLVLRSLREFINSIPGQKFHDLHGKLNKVTQVLHQAAKLAAFANHKDKAPFEHIIDQVLDEPLLLLPTAYAGHAITFIKYGDFLAKCDRGVNHIIDTVIIYKVGNPYLLNKEFCNRLLFEPKTADFINYELKQELSLEPIKTLPTRSQIAGNCSWANVETSVPAMLFMLFNIDDLDQSQANNIQKQIYLFYRNWIEWDKDTALDEVIEDFTSATYERKITKAISLASILVQRSSHAVNRHIERAKKILTILTQPNFQFILSNYIKIHNVGNSEVSKQFMTLLDKCGLNIDKLSLTQTNHYEGSNLHDPNLVKMTTALHVACLQGKLETIQYLVEKLHIDVNYLDRTGSTALMYAAWQGHTDIARLLVNQYQANPKIKNLKGGTATKYAAYAGHYDLAQFLQQFE